jgi:adenylate cyclase
MNEPSHGKSVAILAADAVGFSYAVANDEALALRALGASRRIIDATIEQHAGRIFNTAGDSVLAAFAAPADAVRCALSIQQNLGRETATPLLAFRIGIHLGGVVAEGSNLLGATVNTAARLEAIAPAGGLCMSGDVHDALEDAMQLDTEDLGFRLLKNLIKPVRVFRVLPPGALSQEVVAEARKSRVMVLPLANSSGLSDETYLSEGVTEDIIAGLSRFGLLAVLGMASSDAYRDQSPDLRSLVSELGVDYVVQGSVRRGGDTVRLSARLVDARSGLNVWAQRYDRSTANLFDVQDEISQTIVSTLAGQIEDEGAAMASRKRTENMEAYDFLLRGIHTARATDPRSAKAALELFQKALALDPDYALALSWLALMKLRLRSWNPDTLDVNEISEPAERALAIDTSESWCHLVYGQIAMYRRQFEKAEHHHQRAYELNPFDAHIIALRSPLSVYLGKAAEGEELARRAMHLNPNYPDWYVSNLGLALYCQGRYLDAAKAYAKAAVPQLGILALLAASYAQSGDAAGALASKRRLLELAPNFSARRFVDFRPFAHDEDKEHLMRGLEKAGLPG